MTMNTATLDFRQATPDELPLVLAVLDDAAAWLGRQNIAQWPPHFTGVKNWRGERIKTHVLAGHTWIVRLDEQPVATFSIDDESDPDYAHGWPDGLSDALYIFRMAVAREYAGRQIGTRILDWVSARAITDGKRWIRLDCHRRNVGLQRYYEKHGFERVGTVVTVINDNGHPYTRNSGALYQRPAGTMHYRDNRTDTTMTDRYDPTGEAAIWQAAAQLVSTLKRDDASPDTAAWNGAIEQAARALDSESRAIRQRDGMYFRVISGQRDQAAT